MKIGGVTVTAAEDVLVLPRPLSEDIVIRAKAADLSDYEETYPKPKVPKRIVRGGVEDNVDDPTYKNAILQWSDRRFQYLILTSLTPSNIEWETVDLEKPSTWGKWTEELQAAGFSATECNRIVNCVLAANSLNEAKLREARDAFVRGQGSNPARSSGQPTEPASTPSGEPAKDSD